MTRRETLVYTDVRWMERAACKGCEDPDIFFPHGNAAEPRHGEAVKICRECPVWRECRQWSFEVRDGFAVLGGLTSNQRSRIRNKKKATA